MAGPPSAPRRPVVSLNMIDRDVVERAAELMGVSVYFNKARQANWKDSYTMRITGRKAVDLMTLIRPLMGKRRQAQIDKALVSYNPRMMGQEKAQAIWNRLAEGQTVLEVADEFGISPWTVYDLRAGRTWQGINRIPAPQYV